MKNKDNFQQDEKSTEIKGWRYIQNMDSFRRRVNMFPIFPLNVFISDLAL